MKKDNNQGFWIPIGVAVGTSIGVAIGVTTDNLGLWLDPNYVEAYSNRGISKESLGDLNGACADWKKAAELGDTDAAKWVANQCN